jgi:DNA gyrase/topoisomerase IV subunit B
MPAEDLWKTTIDPETRNLIQVTIEDFQKTEDLNELLMGNANKFAKFRREFIRNKIESIDLEKIDLI